MLIVIGITLVASGLLTTYALCRVATTGDMKEEKDIWD